MNKFFNSFLIFCLCLWLIPLGRFIDKSKEATLCGGQRAVCLCSANLLKSKVDPGSKIELTRSATSSTEKSPSGGAGHEFAVVTSYQLVSVLLDPLKNPQAFNYSLLLNRSIDQVPKA